MGLSVERLRLYECPVCGERLAVDPEAELLVLLHGGGGHVDQVVSVDDVEVHRCRLQSGEREIFLPHR